MTPGLTTATEVDRAIQALRTSGWARSIDGSSNTGYWIEPSNVHVSVANGIVTSIRGQIDFYYSAGEMLEQFGPPEAVLHFPGSIPPVKSCADWQAPSYLDLPVRSTPAHVVYPEQGLWFLMLVPDSGQGMICPEMKLTQFCYYPPRSLDDAISTGYLARTCSDALQYFPPETMLKWHGFGPGY